MNYQDTAIYMHQNKDYKFQLPSPHRHMLFVQLLQHSPGCAYQKLK